jgi:putative phage-type endonuclease
MNAPDRIMPDRAKFIGGSDVGAILGISKWKTPFQLYQEKIGAFVEEVTPEKQRIFDRGHRWEPVVIEMMVDELQARGHEVEIIARNERYIDPELPFLACEVDVELRIDGEEVNGEMKTVHPFAAKEWGEPETDEVPIYYAAQVMHGLMIKPRRRAIIAALIGADDLRIHFMERDEETIAGIRLREIEFWDRIQNRNPPPPVDPEDVKWLYQRDGGTVIEANDEILEMVQHLKDMKASAKAQEAQIEMLAARIKTFMGTNAFLLGPDGKPLATWKNNKDSIVTDWKAAYADLKPDADHISDFTSSKAGARPFNLK